MNHAHLTINTSKKLELADSERIEHLVVSKSNVLSIYLSYPDYISIKIDARQLRDFLSS